PSQHYNMEETPSTEVLHNLVYHIFLPPGLPQEAPEEEEEEQINLALVHSVARTIILYRQHDSQRQEQWDRLNLMLTRLARHIEFYNETDQLQRDISEMEVDVDVLALHIYAQNAAVLVRKKALSTIFEVFEVQASNSEVMSTPGKLVRSYPGPAVEVPNTIVDDPDFVAEISNFLVQMGSEELEESTATTTKAGEEVHETRDSAHPHFISELFLGFLRGMGKSVEPRRVVKRIADEALWYDAYRPWRRSQIWLIIRVAIQTTLTSVTDYKHFMVFFEAQLLLLSLRGNSFSSDLLFAMRAKMSRRLYKVQTSVPQFIMDAVKITSDKTEKTLQKRWGSIQLSEIPTIPSKPTLSARQAAIQHMLPHSRTYLEKLFRGVPNSKSSSLYTPAQQPRLMSENIDDFSHGGFTSMFSIDPRVALLDFEAAVQNHLPAWTSKELRNKSACAIVASCLDQYILAAPSYYTIDAADKSIMVLTIMMLWVSLDRLATSQCPLLIDYSPEIPRTAVEPLLLHIAPHIEHARLVQQHISNRYATGKGSVFTDEVTHTSFSVRYFRQSIEHQQLKAAIEMDARAKRKEKLDDLSEQNSDYAKFVEYANTLDHTFQDSQHRRLHNKGLCEKCQCEKSASNMNIEVHEWPLPSDQVQAESVVFELKCPETFRLWRDATYSILCDLGSSDRGGLADPYYVLTDQDGLGQRNPRLAISDCRITLASPTKPFVKSHYSIVRIPAREDRVCVNSGLSFRLFDTRKQMWAAGPFLGTSFVKYGTLSLSNDSPYHHLRYALEGTSHNSNQVLADQSECPKELSLHEHIAFGSLRSGPRLQWMNIARELEERSLRFNRDEVFSLCAQAAWQLGPPAEVSPTRDWHTELNNVTYGRLLIAQSTSILSQVSANWREATSVRTIVMLVARLFASASDPGILQAAYTFLQEARKVTLLWLDKLLIRLQHADQVSGIIEFRQRVCEVAAICRSTYDIDPNHLSAVLSTPEDISTLLACLVTIHKNQPAELEKAPVVFQVLIGRDRRLAHTTAPIILEKLQQNPHLLDKFMTWFWPDYHAGAIGWAPLSKVDLRWVSTTTGKRTGYTSQKIYFNLLEGQLLIDGLPLGQLPVEYMNHGSYMRLFGQKVLDVIPTSSPNMIFQTRFDIEGHQVLFALDRRNNSLRIQARKNNVMLELVPHSELADDFPAYFSSEFHHWANAQTKVIEFRPLSKPWMSDGPTWELQFSREKSSEMKLVSDGTTRYLASVHSSLFRYVAQRFLPLESSSHIHVVCSSDHQVFVKLPRMKLSFFINRKGELESDNFPHQVLDENQSSGTMIGLRSQLILRPSSSTSQNLHRSRTVLIPHGTVNFSSEGNHVSVNIDTGTSSQVTFHQYQIDTNLRVLATNTGLTSRLFKIYLHAITSYCLPDPLTDRTGTEEALHELSEPATSSFEQIDKEQAQLLCYIGSLTPVREYYPSHLRSMQKTHWLDLSPLSQHSAYAPAVNSILQRADTLQLFHPLEFEPLSYTVPLDCTLLERSARRMHIYFPAEIASNLPTGFASADESDRKYEGRDLNPPEWVHNGQISSWAASLVYRRWKQPTHVPCELVCLFASWKEVSWLSDDLELTYSSSWLYLDLQSSWFSVYDLCRQSSHSGTRYQLGLCLASAVYLGGLPTSLLPTLVAFSTNPDFTNLDPPPYSSYQLSDGNHPDLSYIEHLALSSAFTLNVSPAAELVKWDDETNYKYKQRQRDYYNQQLSEMANDLAREFAHQWPNIQPLSNSTLTSWFETEDLHEAVEQYFASCIKNRELRKHLGELEATLTFSAHLLHANPPRAPTSMKKAQPTSQGGTAPFDTGRLQHLLESRECPDPGAILHQSSDYVPVQRTAGPPVETSRLAALLSEFLHHPSSLLHNRYGKDLENSRVQLAEQSVIQFPDGIPVLELLSDNLQRCQEQLRRLYQSIYDSLGPLTPAERLVSTAGVWPCRTPRAILQRLSLSFRRTLPKRWYKVLMKYAETVVEYQRAQCLVRLAQDNKQEEIFKELDLDSNGSNPSVCGPDLLLIQIDGDFRARSTQVKVAAEMIYPSSEKNTVLQLNMGEGKSSVIVPIVAAVLADRSRMVRVVVLKPLWRQMFQLLISRLAGLAGRRVYYLPFGRHVHVAGPRAQKIQGIYDECMREGGVLLVQPEHALSFQLMTIDQLIASPKKPGHPAQALWAIQDWLETNSRDILDESDELLHVRFQLVYTVGKQQPLEHHPDRWICIQQLLLLASHHTLLLKSRFPDSFKYEPGRDGRFPFIRVVSNSSQAAKQLVHSIANDVLDGRIPSLNLARLLPNVREAALHFLTKRDLPEQNYRFLKHSCDELIWKGLLLFRGMLAHGILLFILKDKHYRVDYGLDCSQSLLAVPYHAKDTPSLRAEFGHPDVAVALTCLSYYYHGLTCAQLENCFELVHKLDDPGLEYEQWVLRNPEIPRELHQMSGANFRDQDQLENTLVPAFSYNSATIDFFLSSVVFPKAAKEFAYKLATSGWDLARVKRHVTTGFSGTNDNQYLLPTSIEQADPVQQSSTNALVLNYLLQPENNNYVCTQRDHGRTCSVKEFLQLLVEHEPEIRVLLDVGAQMLELHNEELIQCWLALRPDVSAGIFFNDRDELVVLAQNSRPVLLVSSPFSQQLDKCIIYLDDGHNRGTDLNLPQHYRAAVTLGPKVTKDRLLQGCMRMRKLGRGQSVIFCAPAEVDDQIREAAQLAFNDPIDALDVIRWAMLQTCTDLRLHVPHWAQQGIDYKRRSKAEKKYAITSDTSSLKQGWTTPESRSLEEMYGPSSSSSSSGALMKTVLADRSLSERVRSLGIPYLIDEDNMGEEREREVNHEVERELNVERPQKSRPAKPKLCQDVKTFIETGVVPVDSKHFHQLFRSLQSFGTGSISAWSPRLLATAEFSNTMANLSHHKLNDYMRPVNWIISGANGVLVIFSPHEINDFLPLIRISTVVRLHVYTPRVTKLMKSFSDLRFYAIPPLPSSNWSPPPISIQHQLNLWAGQLYLDSYEEYRSLCAFLGIYTSAHNQHGGQVTVQSDGFVKRNDRLVLSKEFREYSDCRFKESPVGMIKELTSYRRKRIDYMRSHLGRILYARVLNPSDF
ncbi:hypothetical protein BDV93DRAFT_596925, partial [Ceratobasidium sp. AG-I]